MAYTCVPLQQVGSSREFVLIGCRLSVVFDSLIFAFNSGQIRRISGIQLRQSFFFLMSTTKMRNLNFYIILRLPFAHPTSRACWMFMDSVCIQCVINSKKKKKRIKLLIKIQNVFCILIKSLAVQLLVLTSAKLHLIHMIQG